MNPIINPFIHNISQSEQAIVTPIKASRLFSPLIAEGGSLGVYGERGMGKSLMLNYIAHPPKEWQEAHFQNYIFIFFNCQDTVIPPTVDNFWCQTTKQLNSQLEDSPIKDKCRALLARVTDGLKLDHNDFHKILDVAAGANKRIVLVLDDFDYLIRTDTENLDKTRTFLQGFRSLTTRDSNKANLVIATRYSLQELCKPLSSPYYSAFENGFTNYRLRSFREKELLILLQRVENEVVGEHFKGESGSLFEGLWQGTTEIERLLLMLVALQKHQGKLPNMHYDLSDISEILSQREREIIELTERGLLNRTQTNPPIWDIFCPVFQWWILKEIESSNPEQLDERRKVWGNLVTQKRAEKLLDIVEFLKKNREAIESFGRTILRVANWEIPQLPK